MGQASPPMPLKRLSDEIYVGGQITPQDVPAIAEAGFRAIICNRPDGEAPNQPPFPEIKEAAEQNGIMVRYQPVSGMPSPEDVAAFRLAIEALPTPVLAYCTSGTRSGLLFLAMQNHKNS